MTETPPPLRFRNAEPNEETILLDLFREADEGEERIRAVLRNPAIELILATHHAEPIAASAVRWAPEDPEIIYLAVSQNRRGSGFGRQMLDHLAKEATHRGHQSLLVGTSTSAFDNLAFYQKCGFRMDHIRPDYFAYIQPPVIENGIPMRDMVVFRKIVRP